MRCGQGAGQEGERESPLAFAAASVRVITEQV